MVAHLGEHEFTQAGKEFFFVGDMPIQGHRLNAKLGADTTHAYGIKTFTIGEGEPGLEDALAAERVAFRALLRGRPGRPCLLRVDTSNHPK